MKITLVWPIFLLNLNQKNFLKNLEPNLKAFLNLNPNFIPTPFLRPVLIYYNRPNSTPIPISDPKPNPDIIPYRYRIPNPKLNPYPNLITDPHSNLIPKPDLTYPYLDLISLNSFFTNQERFRINDNESLFSFPSIFNSQA